MKYYSIVVELEAQEDLESIYQFISQNDSVVKAVNFLQELKTQIVTLESLPFRCRKSYYADMPDTYDLIYKGYTIVYKVIDDKVYILTVFRQRSY